MEDNNVGARLFTYALFGAVIFAMVLRGAAWLTVFVSGGEFDPAHPMGAAFTRLVREPSDPAAVWGEPDITTALLYWMIAGVCLAIAASVLAAVILFVTRQMSGFEERSRLGSSPEARMATVRDLVPLIVPSPVGDRFLLGRIGRKYLAAENRTSQYAPGPKHGPSAKMTNDRGAVAVIGPSRSGKTVGVIAAIFDWEGPAVLVSVKDDLLAPTLASRRRRGEVGVFDPTGELGDTYDFAADKAPQGWDEKLLVGWSPVPSVHTYSDAERQAARLTSAAPGPSGHSAATKDFWLESAESLLTAMLYIAARSGSTLGDIVTWILIRETPEEGHATAVTKAMGRIRNTTVKEQADFDRAKELYDGQMRAEPKTLDSIYSTLLTVIKPWISPGVGHSAAGESASLEWLIDNSNNKNNTLYLSAPPEEFERLTAIYGGLVSDLISQIFRHVRRHGPIEPPLLLVLDEAGNMPLPDLAKWASMVAGLGVQMVTVWQDLDQIHSGYGNKSGTIVSNHLSKVFFRGISSSETHRYVQGLLGDEEVRARSESADLYQTLRGSTNDTPQRVALLPANVLRQMPDGQALLIHGSLPPAQVSTIQWFKESRYLKQTKWGEPAGSMLGIPSITIPRLADEPLEADVTSMTDNQYLDSVRSEQFDDAADRISLDGINTENEQ